MDKLMVDPEGVAMMMLGDASPIASYQVTIWVDAAL